MFICTVDLTRRCKLLIFLSSIVVVIVLVVVVTAVTQNIPRL